MTTDAFYPIGTPGVAWGPQQIAQWRSRQRRARSYRDDVLSVIERLAAHWDIEQYGQLDYAPVSYPLLALRSRHWDDALPCMLVTGGVHGYETSGVHGALNFAAEHADDYRARANIVLVPCVSPWGYEHIQRWNPAAIDPNRSFRADSPAPESAALLRLVAPLRGRVLMHIDLHETTDSDESEFRRALAARDGQRYVAGSIPDGFYLVDDSDNPQPEFQQAVNAAVAAVTHIAAAEADGTIIGSAEVAPGVIEYPLVKLGLCASISGARYTTTTEVYPDSARASAQQCNAAQVAAIRAAIDYALGKSLQ